MMNRPLLTPDVYILNFLGDLGHNFVKIVEHKDGNFAAPCDNFDDVMARHANIMVGDIQAAGIANRLDRTPEKFAKAVHAKLVTRGNKFGMSFPVDGLKIMRQTLPYLQEKFKYACNKAGWVFGIAAVFVGLNGLSKSFTSNQTS